MQDKRPARRSWMKVFHKCALRRGLLAEVAQDENACTVVKLYQLHFSLRFCTILNFLMPILNVFLP